MTEEPSTNGEAQEEVPARQDVDVLLDVSELEVDRIKLTVRDLRAHVSVVAELASLVSLQVGVDARLDEVELEIEGVRAKVLLKVRLDDVRAILKNALDTVAIDTPARCATSAMLTSPAPVGSTPRTLRP